MRLINVHTKKLEEFFGDKIPTYAILSTAGATTRLSYLWVDTCCIDKSSSAELSEAINSMYQWYAKSQVCYAYLEDVEELNYDPDKKPSRWFTRGWTLQELLAPKWVEFFGLNWKYLGSKTTMCETIFQITKIPRGVLVSSHEIRRQSIAKRMSWASERQTTRMEDTAYCLLGIFEINMPLLYGEGERAFQRLQEELIKESDDQSIFAWDAEGFLNNGVFARSPADFRNAGDILYNLPKIPGFFAFNHCQDSQNLQN
ncbi:uncharacterized protein LY89DRAFT_699514 [Mollisia scopiformis]|uniref:Uncharacterized protein n=1 Tax=Mollisia scopiformis TaxID=149040 RepID=A0A194WZ27_MOLSC|nr:uncharacterized protein LY89DRAFT_699514 [Mollisia scopiformis]KUJ12954.1 hypothetical protein LY89DRAFT_699514 [Mollisia scopiformis]